MEKDELTTIIEVARAKGVPVRKRQEYDPNVCEFTIGAEHGWQPFLIIGSPLTRAIGFKHGGRDVRIFANREWIRLEVKGDLTIGVFSINRPNKIRPMTPTRLRIGRDGRWPIFIPVGRDVTQRLEKSLTSPQVGKFVESLIQRPSDSIHFFQSALFVYFRPESADVLLNAIDTVESIVGPRNEQRITIDFASLPSTFHYLIPLIRRWSEPDDDKRQQLIVDASPESIRELLAAVEPHFKDIDEYLNSFGSKPLSPAAIGLASLAECAAEARLRLDEFSRNRNN